MDSALRRAGAREQAGARPRRRCARCASRAGRCSRVLAVLPVLWVLFFAPTTGKFATSFGSAVHDPKDFLITVLNGVTAAGLYFVVASGFTLIFGLMRVVNMAHGAFFLLGGYVALKLQRHMVGEGGAFGLDELAGQPHALDRARDRRHRDRRGRRASLMQQLFLRWNQGQDLRQALITIAISIILADQMLAHFGGVAEDIAWPRNLDTFTNLRVSGISVHDDAALHPRHRRRDRAPALALAQAHAHRHGDPRRRRRPRDGVGARDQHPAAPSRSPSSSARRSPGSAA